MRRKHSAAVLLYLKRVTSVAQNADKGTNTGSYQLSALWSNCIIYDTTTSHPFDSDPSHLYKEWYEPQHSEDLSPYVVTMSGPLNSETVSVDTRNY